MESVVLVIHLIFALAIIGLVLLQRSEGGGLGIGGGGGGLGGLASAKGTANALTKMTAICAAGFFATSLTLGVLASKNSQQNIGLLENIDASQVEALSTESDKDDGLSGVKFIPPSEIKDANSSADLAPVSEEIQDMSENPKPTPQTKTEAPSAPIE
jgi:preprotein translocase subunit SecG